ncbi:MAG: hypothetical protein NXH97_05685 [Rhodobacteraceae bacterium]|nr:hypothetical protein [Paracoccaceae bacterium]
MGRQTVFEGDRIQHRPGKTGLQADLRTLTKLAGDLQQVPRDQRPFLTRAAGRPENPDPLGHRLNGRCRNRDGPGAVHGPRRSRATRIAHFGAMPVESSAFVARQANQARAGYGEQAYRVRLAKRALDLCELRGPENTPDCNDEPDMEARM